MLHLTPSSAPKGTLQSAPFLWEPRPVVVGVWLAGCVAALAYVAAFASPLPFSDAWELGPDVVAWPSLERLWSQHNEHRIPLPRLVLAAMARGAGDLRVGMYAQVALLGGLSGLMIFTARRLRGRTSWTDLFFPLLWLHWGNAENLLTSWQLSLTLPIVLGVGVWLPAVMSRGLPGPAALATSSLCLLALPLCGGHGLTQVPALALWLIATGFWLRAAGAISRARVAWAAAAAAVLLVALYFHGLRIPEHLPPSKDPAGIGRVAVQMLALSFGPAVRDLWPAWAVAAGAAALAPILLLARRLRNGGAPAMKSAALAAGAAGILAMALSAGIGRAEHQADAGLTGRYVMLSAPLLCCAYFSLLLGHGRAAAAGPAALAVLAALALPANLKWGTAFGAWMRPALQEVEQEIAAGAGIEGIAARHWRLLYGHEGLAEHLSLFARAGLLPGLPGDDPCAWMPTRPSAWCGDQPLLAGELDGHRIVIARTRSELHYELPPGSCSLTAGFGVHPGALELTGSTCAPVEFRIELLPAGATEPQVLFQRELDPSVRPADRSMQRIQLQIPHHAGGRLTLRTQRPSAPAGAPEPAAGGARERGVDAPYWTGLSIEALKPVTHRRASFGARGQLKASGCFIEAPPAASAWTLHSHSGPRMRRRGHPGAPGNRR